MTENQLSFNKLENKRSSKILAKAKLIQWCKETTLHGFGNILKTKIMVFRILWILIVLAGMAYSLFSNKQN